MAAVLLATSCSKDDENNAPANGRDGVHTVSTEGIPFTIRVNTGTTLKKIGYAEDTDPDKAGNYNITFQKVDEKVLPMKIYNGSDLLTTLYLADAATGEFSGTVETAPSSTADLTAEITTGDDQSPTYSNKSLEDLLATCAHTFKSGVFHYGDVEVKLTDQNAYLAISMSPCCEHEIKINTKDYTVKDGRLWVAVPANAPVTSEGLGTELNQPKEEVLPGVIHAVPRQYFTVSSTGKKVYFSPGNLQYNATPQEGESQWRFAPTQYSICHKTGDDVGNGYSKWKEGDKYKYTDLFGWGTWLNGTDIEEPYETQTDDATSYVWSGTSAIGSEWETLTCGDDPNPGEWNYLLGLNGCNARDNASNLCRTKTVNGILGLVILPDGYGADKTDEQWTAFWEGNINWTDLEKAGAVFLPASGFRYGTDVYAVGDYGNYWSSSPRPGRPDFAFYLRFGDDYVGWGNSYFRYYGQSVRLVRAL